MLEMELLVGAEGVEPATPDVTGWYSNQLNYSTNISASSADIRCH